MSLFQRRPFYGPSARDVFDPLSARSGCFPSTLATVPGVFNPVIPPFPVMFPPKGLDVSDDTKQKIDPNKFHFMLYVKHFSPEELSVKNIDNHIVIHGKHEERVDEHGLVSREFTRRYAIPKDVDASEINSIFTKDGVLTIQAPWKCAKPPKNERVIPITVQRPIIEEQQEKFSEELKKMCEAEKL